jgi:hypothetical protein
VVLAGLSALSSLLVLLKAPDSPLAIGNALTSATFAEIYSNGRFWRVAPLSALGVGTSWSLQGLWAAPWFRDVEGLERSAVIQHLTVMAIAVCAGALFLGTVAHRLRVIGIKSETLLASTLSLSALAQLALILRWPLPPLLPFTIIAAAGAATVLSFAAIGEYFPKVIAGRANGALNLLHVGSAFAMQSATGFLIAQWPAREGSYPAEAHCSAMAILLALQVTALLWFCIAHRIRDMRINSAPVAMMRPHFIERAGRIRVGFATGAGWRAAAFTSSLVCVALGTMLVSRLLTDVMQSAPWSTIATDAQKRRCIGVHGSLPRN